MKELTANSRRFTRGEWRVVLSQRSHCRPLPDCDSAHLRRDSRLLRRRSVETAAVKLASVKNKDGIRRLGGCGATGGADRPRRRFSLDEVNFTEGSFVQADSVAFVIEKDTIRLLSTALRRSSEVERDCGGGASAEGQSEVAGLDPWFVRRNCSGPMPCRNRWSTRHRRRAMARRRKSTRRKPRST